MKRFAQFYRLRNGSYHDALGSDGVAVLDARYSLANSCAQAAEIGRKRGMDGYRIARSTRLFSNPFYLTAAVRPTWSHQ